MSITAAIAVAVSLGQNMYWKDTGEPDGGRATFVGRHGSMKPEGRCRSRPEDRGRARHVQSR